jgi:hypothetical protein
MQLDELVDDVWVGQRRDVAQSVYSPAAILRRMRRMILPLRVLGRPGVIRISSGVAMGPITWRTCSLSEPMSSAGMYSLASALRMT